MKQNTDNGARNLARAVRAAYEKGQTDYTMHPLVRIGRDGFPLGLIQDGDSVIFCCRRGEREIGLTEMFTDPHFHAVPRLWLKDLQFVTLTQYHEKFTDIPVAFRPEKVIMPLAEVLSRHQKTQLHCAESEKYAHVTYFFNGGRNQTYPGEEGLMVPSPKGISYENKPEMSLPELVNQLIPKLGKHDFVLVNFANGDIIGHTQSKKAKIAAAECVSRQLERLIKQAQEKAYLVMITADHGNIEVITSKEGKPDVAHTRNKVPFLLLDPEKKETIKLLPEGSLCDVAPTVLHAMGIPQPAEMTGISLAINHDFGGNRKVMLVVLDGWGLGAQDESNAIYLADTPYWDSLMRQCPISSLNASDGFVGLEDGKAGNSEAGHLNLGAGRIVDQDDRRLGAAIKNNTFRENETLRTAINQTAHKGASLHLLSFLTYRSSHGSIEYALEILKMTPHLPRVFLHIIFDGRSTKPGSAPELLEDLDSQLQKIGVGTVVSGVGRGLVLDRDKNYEKIKLGYDAMVLGTGEQYY